MTSRRLVPAVLAPAGVWAAHTLGYRLAHPDPAAHATALAGHSHLPVLGLVGAGLLVACLAWVAVRDASGRRLIVRLESLLVPLLVAFGALELAERVAVDEAATAALAEPAMAVGLAVQLLVAAVLLVALRGAERVGTWVARRLRPAAAAAAAVPPHPPSCVVSPPGSVWPWPIRRRGPPAALVRL
ncbi:MAG TPA: hypothetical protein VHF25_17250 [Nitriliruptorales bacterium]|nr:hypothetical protein [Nitriliruptorales bacterium]